MPHLKDTPLDPSAISLLGDSAQVSEEDFTDALGSSRWGHVEVF